MYRSKIAILYYIFRMRGRGLEPLTSAWRADVFNPLTPPTHINLNFVVQKICNENTKSDEKYNFTSIS